MLKLNWRWMLTKQRSRTEIPQGDQVWRWGFRFGGEMGEGHAKKCDFKRGDASKQNLAGGLFRDLTSASRAVFLQHRRLRLQNLGSHSTMSIPDALALPVFSRATI